MNKPLSIYIIDDEFPKIPHYVSQSIYQSAIQSEIIEDLILNYRDRWKAIQPLRNLISDMIASKLFKEGSINLLGYSEPEQALKDIDKGHLPDIIIYDWEYNGRKHTESEQWLLEILDKSDATIFVYSHVRDKIPQYLNKTEFDKHSKRFKLFSKGNNSNYIYTTEEFINQYTLSKITPNNDIKIQGKQMEFKSNNYINASSDIILLEKLFGKKELTDRILTLGNTIDENAIENLIEQLNDKIGFDSEKNILYMLDSPILSVRYNCKEELSPINVLKQYGFNTLLSLFEVGVTKI